ncbi:type II secretion system protein GspG [Pseudobacteriovorax antillogorgiicola]|uniref:Type II secretion system protein G (GspG) n=1 Tax=Pseudobacteriovorax antillogorgiicola TaxID=1513793 RepID=A0A1Y6BA58_9BACT|nr:type II secretion system protein GspG [Pseudobacteriovorax antillogorgiicola]TCS57453.1 type II secretion system protein G (GspG) [Pseudobacteriovorax antillogorgiicola]SMF00878.1 type II secretion system protein G (GspG) [Pseudobacteriovorax antillogorgiicola]
MKQINLSLYIKNFRKAQEQQGTQSGMSLIEILIVISIMGGLMAILADGLMEVGTDARIQTTRLQMSKINSSLARYRLHTFKLPTSEQGLDALIKNPGIKRWRGPYLNENQLLDPWGTPLSYEIEGNSFAIISAGPDTLAGTDDDINSQEEGDN